MASTRLRDRFGGRLMPPALAIAATVGLVTFTAAGQTVANATIADLNGVMAFNVYNSDGYTDIIIDIDGLYLPAVSGFATVPSSVTYIKEPSRAPLMPRARTSSRRAGG